MNEEKILTKHPQGKNGVRISKNKYEIIKSTMIRCLSTKDLTHLESTNCVNERQRETFEGSINWYIETVKLDLEARNIIERVKEMKTEVYRLNP